MFLAGTTVFMVIFLVLAIKTWSRGENFFEEVKNGFKYGRKGKTENKT